MEIQPIRILLLEDNPGDARLIREALSESERINAQIDHVSRLSEFEECFPEGNYDVIILDLTLPDATGIETVQKTNLVAPETAIVVLTGISDEELAVKAVQEGAQDYLVKGQADVRVLERVILYALERNLARIRIGALRDQLQRALQEIDEELEISASIQRKIVGKKIPPGWEKNTSIYYAFAKKIGGDLFDIIPFQDKKTLFLIADGSGHSVHAALLSIMFSLSLEHQITKGHEPGALTGRINDELHAYFLDNMFFTAFSALVDQEAMTLTYTTAGHPAQYLLSPSRKEVIRLKTPGIPLCVQTGVDFAEESVEIRTGDKLILFTDGIYECFNDCGEKFGEERLRDLLSENMELSPAELKQKIVRHIEIYNGRILEADLGHQDDSILIVSEL